MRAQISGGPEGSGEVESPTHLEARVLPPAARDLVGARDRTRPSQFAANEPRPDELLEAVTGDSRPLSQRLLAQAVIRSDRVGDALAYHSPIKSATLSLVFGGLSFALHQLYDFSLRSNLGSNKSL